MVNIKSTISPWFILALLRTAFFMGNRNEPLLESGNIDVFHVMAGAPMSLGCTATATRTEPKPRRGVLFEDVIYLIDWATSRGRHAKCHAPFSVL